MSHIPWVFQEPGAENWLSSPGVLCCVQEHGRGVPKPLETARILGITGILPGFSPGAVPLGLLLSSRKWAEKLKA